MTTKGKFKSDAFAAIHASATALQKIGAINQTTMRKFDASCLETPIALEPEQIKKIREQTTQWDGAQVAGSGAKARS